MIPQIMPAQWQQYDQQGFLILGKLLDDNELAALQQRIDDIMLGKAPLDYGRLLMQLDSDTGKYEDAGAQSKGHKGATLAYRKIQDLEFDPLFLDYMRKPIFREICRHVYGDASIAAFRAMFMNKPAHKGTMLPWHQDRWVDLDRDPLITLWTALDPATRANGCVQMIPRSQKFGLINKSHPSGFLTPELTAEYVRENEIVHLELPAGHCALLHNWLLHSSDVNRTEIPRRAFSVCYMDGKTRSVHDEKFTTIFGRGELTPEMLG